MENNIIIEPEDVVRDIETVFLQNGMCVEVRNLTQEEVKEDVMYSDNFPMLTNEYTEESPHTVEIDESKFLNDENYREHWFRVSYGPSIVFVCIRNLGNNIEISAIETSTNYRNMGFGGKVVSGIERHALLNDFEYVVLSPYDSNAESFWENIGYEKAETGRMFKKM